MKEIEALTGLALIALGFILAITAGGYTGMYWTGLLSDAVGLGVLLRSL